MQISEAMDVDPQDGGILCTQWKNFREKITSDTSNTVKPNRLGRAE